MFGVAGVGDVSIKQTTRPIGQKGLSLVPIGLVSPMFSCSHEGTTVILREAGIYMPWFGLGPALATLMSRQGVTIALLRDIYAVSYKHI